MTDKADEKDRKIKELEKQLKAKDKELQRKNDALAEMAAVYALKKSSTQTMKLRTGTNNGQGGQTGDPCFCEFLCCPQNRTEDRCKEAEKRVPRAHLPQVNGRISTEPPVVPNTKT
jgi:hypothetical protein